MVSAIILMITLMQYSGVTALLTRLLYPVISFLGIPIELTEFICLRPFTASGSIAILNDILLTYGADSYIAKCACVMMCSTETVFFASSLYFSKANPKVFTFTLVFSLLLCFLAMFLSCLFCKIFI